MPTAPGWSWSPNPCGRCTPEQIQRYRNKLSGPLLDRIDLHLTVARETTSLNPPPTSDDTPAKAAGLVVHPAAGHASGTLLNALLHHVPDIINVPRAGIVHRLDKDTTGLMVVAKTIQAQTQLVTQLQSRSVSRIYECIVIGVVTAGGKIDAPIGRHGQQRQRMAVMEGGKQAVSHYRVLERFRSDRKSTRLNSSHVVESRMPSSA